MRLLAYKIWSWIKLLIIFAIFIAIVYTLWAEYTAWQGLTITGGKL